MPRVVNRRIGTATDYPHGVVQKTAPRNRTTSVLTATTLIYAIGAGITAAAGTRLALQWILTKVCKLGSL